MRQFHLVALALLCGVAAIAPLPGCGPSAAEQESRVAVKSSMEESALAEVGTLYRLATDQNKRPPGSVKDFEKDGLGYAFGYDWLRRGDLVAFWGANLSDSASGTVLAYEKKAPGQGGFVLMQDGKTVKHMSAEEFKAAPKAGAAK